MSFLATEDVDKFFYSKYSFNTSKHATYLDIGHVSEILSLS